ncbi:MAG: NTP transferase domain-containing protein [Candidatus Omnitrophica bacterium]|nr:NTP transferase domain-containing protein [Candidatus Omnitrophota bacterium]
MKMKKTANRIVSVAILVAFLFTNTAFAYPQNYSSLRPRPSSERADTLAEAIQKELVEIIYPSGKPLNLANLTGDDVVVVSMSAGEGTRFKSTIPKVIAPLAGKPLAQHNIDTARANGWKTVTVVVGHRKGEVIKALSGVDAFITQPDTKSGTANAAMQVAKVPGLLESSGLVLITGGDTCIKPDVMAELVKRHKAGNNAITMLTIDAPEKGGAGRIVRNPKTNAIDSIAERKDIEVLIAAGKPYRLKDGTELPAQQVLATREKNRSTYVISAKLLGQLLGPVTNDNAQRQFYLTDMIANAVARGMRVDALTVDSSASLDANTVEDLARAEQILASGWGATPPPSGTPSHRPEGAPSEDPLKREVEQAALQWFRPGATRADEIKLEEFLKAKGEKAIEYFVQLVETDRGGESIGTWRIPPTDFNNPRTKKLLEKFPPGSHICTSVENDDEGKPIPYYMPETLEGVMNWFEKERIKMMSRVAIQRALGRKMVVDVGVGVVGNIELTCGCANKIDMPAKQYAKSPRFRPPVSGKDQHNTFAIGYEPIGDGTYRQDMIDRGLVGVRAEDPEQLKAAREGHERGNLAGTFLPQVLSVCDVSLLSIPQHPFKTMHDHPENIYADPRGGLEVVEMVAEFMPPRAACIIESTVYPFYYSLFALPVFEEVMKKRNLPRQEQPQLCYSFQRMEPGPRGWRSNKQQIRMGGAATEEGLEALKQYFEMSNYKYSSSKKVVATELTKDSENAIRYQIIASSAPMQDMFEALGLDIYAETRRIAEAMVMQGISGKNEQAVIKEAIESMRNAYERAAEYAETQIPDKTARDTFTGQVRSVFNQSATAILTQAVLYPGGYCVIEQIGHLIYGMVATKLVTELDVKAIFDPALKTIAYMKMRQRELAGWVVSELADKGIEPQDTKIWGGGATYMPQIGDGHGRD